MGVGVDRSQVSLVALFVLILQGFEFLVDVRFAFFVLFEAELDGVEFFFDFGINFLFILHVAIDFFVLGFFADLRDGGKVFVVADHSSVGVDVFDESFELVLDFGELLSEDQDLVVAVLRFDSSPLEDLLEVLLFVGELDLSVLQVFLCLVVSLADRAELTSLHLDRAHHLFDLVG